LEEREKAQEKVGYTKMGETIVENEDTDGCIELIMIILMFGIFVCVGLIFLVRWLVV